MPDDQALAPSTDEQLRTLLAGVRRIAVVGVSADPSRASHDVARWLIEHTELEVTLVNPHVDELFGRPVHDTLAAIPEPPELVDVFRRSQHLPELAAATREVGARVLWTQFGVRDDQVAAGLRAGGIAVVQDRCLKVDWARLRPHG